MFKTIDEVKGFIQKEQIQIIDFKIIDMIGRWHHLSIPVARFTESVLTNGIGFDGSSYGFLTVEKSDMVFVPDLSTAFVDPFVDVPTLVMIGDIYRLDNGKRIRFEDDPRYIAKKAEELLKSKGIADTVLLGPEFEFYVLDHVSYKNETNHMEVLLDAEQGEWNAGRHDYQNLGIHVRNHGGYHVDYPFDSSYQLRSEVTLLLEKNNVPVKYHHSENGGPGQVEIEVEFAPLLEMADRTMKLKYILRNAAYQANKTISFMPKPFVDECGSGMHIHMHMFKDGQPIFYDAEGYAGFSQTALYAIGGILKHAPALMPFTNPSTNSYKRLVPGYEAPVSICYALSNRSAVIRIPGYATEPMKKRFEVRSPDATCNPYLAYASVILAAIDGIENKIDPVAEGFGPYDVNLYQLSDEEKAKVKGLPTNLVEASEALKLDDQFLTKEGVFSKNLIQNQHKRILADHYYIAKLPHPEEFIKYYNL
ncbi:MAG: type I glutamate--ammonia ligase [Clostridia bacterium]|nr:type I glutamate--ammonia ligase [Clostridia bacterium]